MELSKHPKELWILSLTELCERFAFWGVGNLLVLYLIEFYQYRNENATHIYGLFTGLSAFLPFIGGWIADRWNYQSPLFLGALINSFGCFCLASGVHFLLYPSLAMMAIGYGLFTPSLVTVLAYTYRKLPDLRHAGFSIYYASINVGVFFALVIMGTVAKLVSWEMAFVLAGFVQIVGLIPLVIYLVRHKETYEGLKKISQQNQNDKKKISTEQKDRLKVIGVFYLATILFWFAYNQGFSSMEIFAHDYMSRMVGSVSLPEGIFLSSESFFLILLAPFLATLYVKLKKKKKDPSAASKSSIALYFMAAGFFVMMLGSLSIPSGASSANVSWGYLVGAYFLIAVAEMLFAPIGLSMMSHLAPRKFKALSVGLWYACVGIAFYLGGLVAGLMNQLSSLSNFFFIFVITSLIPAIYFTFIRKWLTRRSHYQGSFD